VAADRHELMQIGAVFRQPPELGGAGLEIKKLNHPAADVATL
jgi:hypothetical protein